MTGSELIAGYRERAVVRQGMVLLPRPVALAFLEDCERNEVRLLGVDAFGGPVGGTIAGPVEDALDLSGKAFWDYSVAELCELLREFIEGLQGDERLFEFVADD